MDIKIRIVKGVLSWGDLIDLETPTQRTVVNVMAKFVVGEDDEFLPHDEALKLLRSVPDSEIEDVISQFQTAMKGYKEAVIPPTGGGK